MTTCRANTKDGQPCRAFPALNIARVPLCRRHARAVVDAVHRTDQRLGLAAGS